MNQCNLQHKKTSSSLGAEKVLDEEITRTEKKIGMKSPLLSQTPTYAAIQGSMRHEPCGLSMDIEIKGRGNIIR